MSEVVGLILSHNYVCIVSEEESGAADDEADEPDAAPGARDSRDARDRYDSRGADDADDAPDSRDQQQSHDAHDPTDDLSLCDVDDEDTGAHQHQPIIIYCLTY